jgi:protein-tyrosine phosphatase
VTSVQRPGVLFVCLGNICRSPLARVVFADLLIRRGLAERFDIDSCGMGGWHVGGPADPRAVAVAARHGLLLTHTARQIDPRTDFDRFGLLLAMDRSNRDALVRAGAAPSQVRLMRSFDPGMAGLPEAKLDVPDPYYGAGDGFETVYQMLSAASEGLLAHLLAAASARSKGTD